MHPILVKFLSILIILNHLIEHLILKKIKKTSPVDQYITMRKPWDNEDIPDTNIEELEKLLKDIFD